MLPGGGSVRCVAFGGDRTVLESEYDFTTGYEPGATAGGDGIQLEESRKGNQPHQPMTRRPPQGEHPIEVWLDNGEACAPRQRRFPSFDNQRSGRRQEMTSMLPEFRWTAQTILSSGIRDLNQIR